MRAITIHEPGGPGALVWGQVDDPSPRAGEAIIEVAAAGLNYIDVYHRTGRYNVRLPFTPGVEAAGTVVAVANDVTGIEVGMRVAWVMEPGGYGELAAVDAGRLVEVPADLDLRLAAAAMLQGLTAHYLTESVYAAGPSDVALVHAAAGGVGQLLVQLLVRRGVRVIGTASTSEKRDIVAALGADEVMAYEHADGDFADRVLELTQGRGVDVVFDGVGRATFDRGLEALRPRGMMALFGGASGPVAPIDPIRLAQLGSLFLTRPTLADYVRDRDELVQRTAALFGWLQRGELDITIDRVFDFPEAPAAHEYLEARRTRGKVLLVPPRD